MSYAKDTNVTEDRSRAEIERILRRYKATAFGYGWEDDRALIKFTVKGRTILCTLQMPNRSAQEFLRTPERGFVRTMDQAHKAWEQACRQRWRALCLVIKAKLEAVEAGISTIEHEFLAWTVLPNGETLGSYIGPMLERALDDKRMVPLMLAAPENGA